MTERDGETPNGEEDTTPGVGPEEPAARGLARLDAISRHPIISTTVAGVLTAALLWALNLDGGGAGAETVADITGDTPVTTTTAGKTSTTVPATTTTTVPGPLLLVSATRDMDFYGDGWTVALHEPFPADQHGQWPAEDSDVLDWALDRGASFVHSALEVVIEGNAGSTVTITGARAVVLERETPQPPAYLTSESAGADELIGWYFDLDETEPVALAMENDFFPDPDDLDPFFSDQVITVAPGEVVALHVEAAGSSCDCTWVIELDAVVGGTRETITVDRDGEPFRTVGFTEGIPHYGFSWWEPDVTFVEYLGDGDYRPLP